MKLVSIRFVEPERLAVAWEKCFGEKYRASACDIVRLGQLDENFVDEASRIAIGENGEILGFIELKRAPGKFYRVPNSEALHIHSFCFETREVGEFLLGFALDFAQGADLVFGQDHGHFWPGLPEGWSQGEEVLSAAGFTCADSWENDLDADLSSREYKILNGKHEKVRFSQVADGVELDRFLREEFDGRWRYDALCSFHRNPSSIAVLEVKGRIEGFAILQSFAFGEDPFAGAVWHRQLGKNWGALGPIGVSAGVRGVGLGGILLEGGLGLLKSTGVQQCTIDWTTLVDFYGKYGFSVSRRYRHWSRKK